MHTPRAHPAPWLATVTVAVALLGAAVTTFATSQPAPVTASGTAHSDRATAQVPSHAGPRT
jgi:hypothetical protein